MSLFVSVAIVAAVFLFGECLKASVADFPFDDSVRTVILNAVLSLEFCVA